MSRVAVKRELLQWALSRSGRAEELEELLGVSEWLAGEKRPTVAQLEKLARATATPLGYFFLDRVPKDQMPIPLFRTGTQGADQPSLGLLRTVQMMERRQSWMREFLIDEGSSRLDFVGSVGPDTEPEAVAAAITKVLRVDVGWAARCPSWTEAQRVLRDRVEEAGILVASNSVLGNNTKWKLDREEFRGFVLVDDYAPLVFINGADFKAAQMFTLAHEVAHVWLGTSAAFDLAGLAPASDRAERACDRVAAEFLVPTDAVKSAWRKVQHASSPFDELARHFKVSGLVAARRALDLKLIPKKRFFEYYESQEVRHARAASSGGGDFYNTQTARLGRRFSETVVGALANRRITHRDAYRLTGLYGQTFSKYAKRLGHVEQ